MNPNQEHSHAETWQWGNGVCNTTEVSCGLFLPTWSLLLRHHTACLRWLCRRWWLFSAKKNHLRPLGLLWKCKPPTTLNNHIVFNIIFPLYRAIGGNYTVPQFGTNPVESDKEPSRERNMCHKHCICKYGSKLGHHGVPTGQTPSGFVVATGHFGIGWSSWSIPILPATVDKPQILSFDRLWHSIDQYFVPEGVRSTCNPSFGEKTNPLPKIFTLDISWHFVTRFNHFFNAMLSIFAKFAGPGVVVDVAIHLSHAAIQRLQAAMAEGPTLFFIHTKYHSCKLTQLIEYRIDTVIDIFNN